jgi:DNA-binding MarR family transcriptional regulator
MSSEPPKIAGQIRRVINRSMFLEKRTIFHHESLRLYPSELHLLQVLNEGTDPSAGEMAQKLGISIGAVSQTLNRLEKKGVIHKTKDPALKNRLKARLTEVGQTAIRQFEQGQEVTMKAFSSYMGGLSNGERKVIEGFLSHLEEFLRRLKWFFLDYVYSI